MSIRRAVVLLAISLAALAIAFAIWLAGILGYDCDPDG